MRYIKASSPIKHETLKNNDIVYFLSKGRRGVGIVNIKKNTIEIYEKFTDFPEDEILLYDYEKLRIVSSDANPEYFI